MSEWQPIETAPQDTLGVVVYAKLCCHGEEGRLVMVAGRDRGTWVYPDEHHFIFTHWMPLPEPPEQSNV